MPAPDINLEIGSGSHAERTARIMLAFEPICIDQNPDWVVVVGDVNSSLACKLVASKLGIKVAHIEAGLRSFDRTMPEEVSRVVTDALADLLLTPSADADENLRREGVSPLPSKIRFVGNMMIDTRVANSAQSRQSLLLERLGLQSKGVVYVTLHRPSNVDDEPKLNRIMEELTWPAEHLVVVFPVHPRTRCKLEGFYIPLCRDGSLKFIEPIGYHDSLWLTENARFVLTDSEGIQEEFAYVRTPCLTLRPNTGQLITNILGTNKLTRLTRLSADIEHIVQERRGGGRFPKYWAGRTAERILDAILEYSFGALGIWGSLST